MNYWNLIKEWLYLVITVTLLYVLYILGLKYLPSINSISMGLALTIIVYGGMTLFLGHFPGTINMRDL